jgi:hypothetical protein
VRSRFGKSKPSPALYRQSRVSAAKAGETGSSS